MLRVLCYMGLPHGTMLCMLRRRRALHGCMICMARWGSMHMLLRFKLWRSIMLWRCVMLCCCVLPLLVPLALTHTAKDVARLIRGRAVR